MNRLQTGTYVQAGQETFHTELTTLTFPKQNWEENYPVPHGLYVWRKVGTRTELLALRNFLGFWLAPDDYASIRVVDDKPELLFLHRKVGDADVS